MINANLEHDMTDNVDLECLSDRVTELLKMKDHPPSMVDSVENAVLKLETIFFKNKDKFLKQNRALYWFKLGQLYNITNKYKKQSVDPLSKAVKLDPTLVEAWNELGESYWYNNEVDLAQKCFENALLHQKSKLPLRNLSIIMRKMAVEKNENKLHYIQKGIEYAKDSVNLDLQDGVSWGILGNAYLSAYFGIKQDVQYARLALSAYKQAEKLPFSMLNTELHYNKAFACKYSDMYLEALKSLDRSLEIENTWEPACKLKTDLLKYLNEVHNHNLSKGKLKPKKLLALQKELLNIQDGLYLEKGKKLLQLNELKEGKNCKVNVIGKIIWNLSLEGSFPFTCGFIDVNGFVVVVMVYNMTPGKGFIIGDTIVIPDPTLMITEFDYENKNYSFLSIRVDNPTNLIVNKRRLSPAYFTAYSLVTKEKDQM